MKKDHKPDKKDPSPSATSDKYREYYIKIYEDQKREEKIERYVEQYKSTGRITTVIRSEKDAKEAMKTIQAQTEYAWIIDETKISSETVKSMLKQYLAELGRASWMYRSYSSTVSVILLNEY